MYTVVDCRFVLKEILLSLSIIALFVFENQAHKLMIIVSIFMAMFNDSALNWC